MELIVVYVSNRKIERIENFMNECCGEKKKEEIKFLHIYKQLQQHRRLCKEIFFFLLRKGDHQMKCSCDVIRVLARDTHIGFVEEKRTVASL